MRYNIYGLYHKGNGTKKPPDIPGGSYMFNSYFFTKV